MKEKIARDCHYSSSLHLEASLSSLRLYRTDFLLNFCPYLRQLVFIMCQVGFLPQDPITVQNFRYRESFVSSRASANATQINTTLSRLFVREGLADIINTIFDTATKPAN